MRKSGSPKRKELLAALNQRQKKHSDLIIFEKKRNLKFFFVLFEAYETVKEISALRLQR